MKKEKLFLQMIKVVICKPQKLILPCDTWNRGKFFCRGRRLSRAEGERERLIDILLRQEDGRRGMEATLPWRNISTDWWMDCRRGQSSLGEWPN